MAAQGKHRGNIVVPQGRVTVIGSFNQDIVLRLPRMPVAGETLVAEAMDRFPGGKGSNQAIAAARAGATVTLLACLGADAAGEDAQALWRAEGVAARVSLNLTLPTGTAVILLEPDGRNRILLAPGANAALPPTVPGEGAEVVLAQLEVPTASIVAAFAASDAIRVLNAAPADLCAARILLPLTDILLVNEGEATALAAALAPGAGTQPADLARALATRVGLAAIVTAGDRGAFLARPQGRSAHAPALRVTVCDTTGAGDAFAGALVAAIAAGTTFEEALRRGACAGSLACTMLGAVPSLPHAAAIAAALASQGHPA